MYGFPLALISPNLNMVQEMYAHYIKICQCRSDNLGTVWIFLLTDLEKTQNIKVVFIFIVFLIKVILSHLKYSQIILLETVTDVTYRLHPKHMSQT